MAKKSRKSGLNRAAAGIGAELAHLRNKYDTWVTERDELASQLGNYVSSAKQMLAGMDAAAVVFGRAVTASKRVISEEHKRKIFEGAKARWAKRKARKAPNVSPEVRAKLARLAKARWAKAKKAGKTKLG